MGRIGFAVAKRLRAFSVGRILYSGTKEKEEAKEIGAKFVELDTLLRESDYVIPCCSLNEKTTNLFNSETFSMMKPNSILINTSRGGVVNQSDLYDALKEKKIAAAGLDVTTPEPLPLNSPLLSLPNCVILPHIGSATIETRGSFL